MPRSTRSASPAVRRVLVGSDFSPGASAALSRVSHLPLAPSAEITILHVRPGWLHPAVRTRQLGQAEHRLRQEALHLLRALRATGRQEVRVRTVLSQGEAWAEILRRSASADLVVVGRHGRRSFHDLLVGSTAEQVVRRAAVPTLLVARRARSAYRRPLAAVDLSEASRATLSLASRFVGRAGPLLDVVHAYHPEHEQVLERVATKAGRAAHRRECRLAVRRAVVDLVDSSAAAPLARRLVLRRADPRSAILSVARARGADLIALGTHGRAGLAHLLLGSVAEGVMRHATCDVLVASARGVPRRSQRRAA